MTIKNRKLRLPESGKELYELDEKELDSESEKIARTDQFRYPLSFLSLQINFIFTISFKYNFKSNMFHALRFYHFISNSVMTSENSQLTTWYCLHCTLISLIDVDRGIK